MGRRIEAIKRSLQQSPEEVMASYLYYFVLNSKDHFWKNKYYDRTAYFELNNDNNAYFLDVLYCGEETSFLLSTFMKAKPDYKSVLAITEQLLCWLENTYAIKTAVVGPVATNEPRRTRRRSAASQQQRAQSATRMGSGNTPRKDPQNGRAKTS